MYALRKIGFYISVVTLVGGALAVVLMLLLGIGLGSGDDEIGAIFGMVFAVIAVIALIGVGVLVLLMAFYQRSIVIPLLFLIIFGSISLNLASANTPVFYITLGLTIGPFVTVIGYFFKNKANDTVQENYYSNDEEQ